MILNYLTNCKVLSTVTQEQDEEQWLKNRMQGIGGSDIGAICGVNKYMSPRLLYLIKTGQYEMPISKESKERMYWGRIHEPIIANEFAKRTNKIIQESPATLQHKDYPWAIANVDRFIVDEQGRPYGVLECKTADWRLNKDWEEGEIPRSYIYQIMWYLWITGLEYGAFAALIGGNKFYYYEVFRDDELLNNEIIPKADKFWNYHIKNMIEPELTGMEVDSNLVKEKYKDVVKNSEISLYTDEANELANFVFEKKKQLKQLEKEIEEASNKLKEMLKDKEIGYTVDRIIKWSPVTQTRIDTDKLRLEYPEVYEKVKKTITFRTFTVK